MHEQFAPREPAHSRAHFSTPLAEALDTLRHIEAFQTVVAEISELCDESIDQLEELEPQLMERHAGKIAAYRAILALING